MLSIRWQSLRSDTCKILNNGQLKDGVKAGEIVAWLKEDFDLEHGHSMAIFAIFKGIKKEGDT